MKLIGNQYRKPKGLLGKIISGKMQKENWYSYEELFSIVDPAALTDILEIGFGHGLGLKYLLDNFQTNLYGLDYSELMYREASRINKKYIEEGRLHLDKGDFLSEKFYSSYSNHLSERFELIYCINVIYFWPDLLQPFSQIRSLLKTGGRFALYMHEPEKFDEVSFASQDIFSRHSLEDVQKNCELAGFGNIFVRYGNGFYMVCEKRW